jgi:hypothetical protein
MKLPGVIGALVLVAFVWGVFGLRAEPEVTQPIAFPHKTHVEQNLQCTTCHERAEKDAVAGRPPTELCLSCHGGGDGTGEIKKLQAFEKHGEIPWNRVWRLPRHVFFPHRTHVVVAKLPCQTCHGPMETLVRPPGRPLKTLAMNDCIACHEERERQAEKTADRTVVRPARSLSRDCTICHR